MSYVDKIRNSYPEDFFVAETKCDYYIPENMKKLWALEIDCYKEFCNICAQYDLKHFVMFGALLGAVRHKGFIPWDDDFDVVMPRKDYNKFISLSQDNFKYPYFLQTPNTDPEYCISYARLCNSESCHLPKAWKTRRFNLGAHIDVFALDRTTPNVSDELYKEMLDLALICSSRVKKGNTELPEDKKRLALEYESKDIYGSNIDLINLIHKKGSTYENEATGYLGVTTLTPYHFSKMIWSEELFLENTQLPFENIQIIAPKRYDEVLRVTYNNYMQLPPLETRGLWHGQAIYEPDIPYKHYMEKQFGMVYDDYHK